MTSESLLLLLSVSLGAAIPNAHLEDVQWDEVYRLAASQGVMEPAFDGLQKLRETRLVKDVEDQLYYTWLGQVMVQERKYAQHKHVIGTYARCCEKEGAQVYVLKGLAFGVNYPVPEHRPCGDIDVFIVDGLEFSGNNLKNAYEIGNKVAHKMGAKVDTHWYKHSQIHLVGAMIENHDYLVCTRESRHNKELNIYLQEMLQNTSRDLQLLDTGALIPPVEFNALFQAYHSMSHFTSEGISLRHVLDWATFLQRHQLELDWKRFYADCKYYHFDRFINALTDIAVHKLGVKVADQNIVTESPYADKILNSILNDTDAKVFGTPGGAWNHRRKLVQNTFKYAWKYREIAQESPLRHVWTLVMGYFLHNED